MKKRIILIFILSVLFFAGCSTDRNTPKLPVVNSKYIKDLAVKAINGDMKSNRILSNFMDLKIPVPGKINKLTVDSINAVDGKKFYLVLAEFPNPVYNRFAIYDTLLRAYLIDKSLNGFIDYKLIDSTGKRLVELSEDFMSKDILELQRISLYGIFDTTAGLIFRNYTRLITPEDIFTQSINLSNPDTISTVMESKKKSVIKDKHDIFIFDVTKKEYSGGQNIFDGFVIKTVTGFEHKPGLPEITDQRSAMMSVGLDPGFDTLKTTSNTTDNLGFTLTLTDNWNTFRNFAMDDYFSGGLKGTRFVNEAIGATISVVKIPMKDSAEAYTYHKLTNSASGKYLVRYSDKILSARDFTQYFEFTCGSKKFLLVLRASRHTYDKYKEQYQNIINSFSIDC